MTSARIVIRDRSDYGWVESILIFFRVFILYLWSSEEKLGSFLFFLVTHTQRQTTVIGNLLDEQSARRRDLYLKIFTTNIQATCRIWSRDPSKREAADVRLRRPLGPAIFGLIQTIHKTMDEVPYLSISLVLACKSHDVLLWQRSSYSINYPLSDVFP